MALSNSDLAAFASWDALETRDRIRKKEVTAREVLEAAVTRAGDASHLGAVVELTLERARERLRALDAAAPLAGVPTFIKDLAQLEGVPITWGSRASGRYVSRATDPVAGRLEASGLVTLGKSACPELGMTATTESLGRPPCKNPWDPSRSAGGSSGGAGALVAAGVVPIAHATDGGGSIRIPAACCGLVGLKPSRGRLDTKGSNLLPVDVACEGVVTRSVRDTLAFFDAVEPPRARGRIGPSPDRPERLRIGAFVDAPVGTPVHPEVQAAVRDAVRLCRSLGHEVEEIPCPFEGQLIDDFLRYWGVLAWLQARVARRLFHRGFDASQLEPWTLGLARFFARDKLAGLAAIGRLRRFSRTFASRLQGRDVLLSPVLAEPAPPLGYLATDAPFETAFERIRAYAPFTPLYNASGAPAISLPLGRSEAGLPIGVQLAAAPGRDGVLLALALAIEAAQPWPRLAPREAWAKTT